MTRIQWVPHTVADLDSIHAFVARDSEHYAALLIERLIASVDALKTFPMSGRTAPERPETDLRELVCAPYRIVYRILGDEVHILTVFRSSRLLPPGFESA